MRICIKISRNSAFLGSDKSRMLFLCNSCWLFNIYEQEKFHAQLSKHKKCFITSGPGLAQCLILETDRCPKGGYP